MVREFCVIQNVLFPDYINQLLIFLVFRVFLAKGIFKCLISLSVSMCDHRTSEKEIVRGASENATKRHLPSWMLPKVGAATISVGNSDNSGNSGCSETDALAEASDSTENTGTVLKKKKTATGHKRETSRRKSYSHAEGEVKRRRKLNEQDANGNDNAIQKDKKKEGGSQVRFLKSSVKKSQIVEDPNHVNIDVNSVQGFNDDDMELKIDDLMAIAQEYVKDYENKEQKEASNSPCESVKQFVATRDFGNSLDSHCDRERSSTPAREGLYSYTSNKNGELVPTGTSQFGDPAQDMLDILLGPLLKKPLEEEENKSIVDSVEFNYEPTGKSQEEFSVEDKVPLTKRKSSLKDKVLLFLD